VLRKTNTAIGLVVLPLLLNACAGLVGHRDKEVARIQLQRAADLLNQRQYTQAIEAAGEALKADPHRAAAHNLLGLIHLETKRYEKSEEAFRKALEMQPVYPEASNNMGVLFNRQERFEEAIACFKTALKDESYITPENAYTNMGYAQYRLGRYREALDNHQRALDISPLFCLASKNMGDVFAKQKAFPKASRYYDKAVTHCPLYQESQYKLGLVLMKMGQRKVAKAEFEKLLQRHKEGPFVEKSSEVLKWLR
jgi:type IV pilus assembly protein PilF